MLVHAEDLPLVAVGLAREQLRQVPHAHGAVVGAAEEAVRVRGAAAGDAADAPLVAGEVCEQVERLQVPDAQQAVLRGGDEHAADGEDVVDALGVGAPLVEGGRRVERRVPLLDEAAAQPAEDARAVDGHAVDLPAALVVRARADQVARGARRRRVRHLVERRQHVEHRRRRVVQRGDRDGEGLVRRERVAVAHGPAVARRAVGLEDGRRLAAAAEAQRDLAARRELRGALEDEEVARLAGAVEREQRVGHLGRPELRGGAAHLDARDDELDRQQLPRLARREDHEAQLAPRALARRLVGVVVQHEVGRLGVARELARERVHVLLGVVLDDVELVRRVAVGDALGRRERARLVALVEAHRERVGLHAHPELLLVEEALDKGVGRLLRPRRLGRVGAAAAAAGAAPRLLLCDAAEGRHLAELRLVAVDGRVDQQAALVLARVGLEAEAVEHERRRARRRHLHRLRDRHRSEGRDPVGAVAARLLLHLVELAEARAVARARARPAAGHRVP